MKTNRFTHVFLRFICVLTILFLFIVRPELGARTFQQPNKPLDSLLKILPSLKDTARTYTLARIAVEYAGAKDVNKMLLFKAKAFAEAPNARIAPNLFLLNFYAGSGFRQLGKWDSSLYYFNIAEKKTTSQTETLVLAEFYRQKADALIRISQESANFQTAILYLKKSLKLYEKNKKWTEAVQIHRIIGQLYQHFLANPQLALDYLETAYSMIEKRKITDRGLKIDVLIGLVQLYETFQKPDEARAFLNYAEREAEMLGDPQRKFTCSIYKALLNYAQKKYRACIVFAHNALKYAKQANSIDDVASAELTLGNGYEALLSLDTALTYYQQGVAHFKQLGLVNNQGVSNLFIAGIYYHQKKWHNARRYLDSAETQFHYLNDFNYLIQIARLNARVDSAQGDFKSAYLRRKEEEEYKDRAVNEENFKNFEKVYEKFALERAHEKTRAQQRQAQTENARQKNERDWLQLSGAFMVVLVVLILGAILTHKKIAPIYGGGILFIGILFFFEILLEISDRGLKSTRFNEPIYQLVPNLFLGATLSRIFHFIRLRLIKK